MKKSASRSLRFVLTASTPLRGLPSSAIRQLIGYYGDWRRSRDILNAVDEAAGARSYPEVFLSPASLPGSSNSYTAR
jgi:hypothetical protein